MISLLILAKTMPSIIAQGLLFFCFIYIFANILEFVSKERRDAKKRKERRKQEEKEKIQQKHEENLNKQLFRQHIIHRLDSDEKVSHHKLTIYSSEAAILRLYFDNEEIKSVIVYKSYDFIEFDEHTYIPEHLRNDELVLPIVEGEPIKEIFPECKRIEIIEREENSIAQDYEFEIRSLYSAPIFLVEQVKLVQHSLNDKTKVLLMKYMLHYNHKLELIEV